VIVGVVSELWRYPVKSMGGEALERAEVIPTYGIPGDRGWALRDEQAGEIRGAKKLHSLVQFQVRYLTEPAGDSAPPIEITFPDGRVTTSDDPQINELLSAELGKPVTLWSRQPADNLDHYRRVVVNDEAEYRAQLALLPDEPIPDYSAIPPEVTAQLYQYTSPPGTYFDAFSLSMITTASMDALGAASPGSVIGSRRFRQNIVAQTNAEISGFVDPTWVGRELRIGTMRATVLAPISRCVMVTLPQDDLPQDRSLMRTLVKHTGQDLGIYLTLTQPGTIRTGDAIELI